MDICSCLLMTNDYSNIVEDLVTFFNVYALKTLGERTHNLMASVSAPTTALTGKKYTAKTSLPM